MWNDNMMYIRACSVYLESQGKCNMRAKELQTKTTEEKHYLACLHSSVLELKYEKSAAEMEYSNTGFDSELFVLTHMDLHADESKSVHLCTCSKGRRADATFSNHRQELHLFLQISNLYFSMDK